MKKILILLVCSVIGHTFRVSAANAKHTGVFNNKKVASTLYIGASMYQRILTGTVYDETGVAIPGVTIKVQGSVPERGVMTNTEGKFNIQINSESDVLVFSYVGYTIQKLQSATKRHWMSNCSLTRRMHWKKLPLWLSVPKRKKV